MTPLEQRLGFVFREEQLLQIALIHRSLCKEYPDRTDGLPSNERMEFLGDAILNFLTSAWLYERFPDLSEGKLSSMRALLVRMTTLARFARLLDLSYHVRISHSEEVRGGRERDGLLADTFEAIVGAIYLDQGIDAARAFVGPFLDDETDRILAGQGEVDYRTRLQHVLQSQDGNVPTYQTRNAMGPAHRRVFTVDVLQGDKVLGTGTGYSKQAASQEAAHSALAKMALAEEQQEPQPKDRTS